MLRADANLRKFGRYRQLTRDEQAPQRYPHIAFRGERGDRAELFFDGPKEEAGLRGELLQRQLGIFWADIAHFDDPFRLLLQPPKGEALGPADVGAHVVDATGPLAIQERATAGGARRSILKQFWVVCFDTCRFNREDGEPVEAAPRAAAPTTENPRVRRFNRCREGIYCAVKALHERKNALQTPM